MQTASPVVSLILGLGVAAGWGLSDYAAARASRQFGATWPAFMSQILGAGAMGVIVLITQPPLHLTVFIALLTIFISACYAVAILLLYRAFALAPVGIVSVIGGSYALVSVIFGVLFLGESLSIPQYIAIVLILGGLAAVSFHHARTHGRHAQRGIVLALLSIGLWGVSIPLVKPIVHVTGWVWLTLVLCLLRIVWTAVFRASSLRHNYQPSLWRHPTVLYTALGQLAGNIMLHYGLSTGRVTILVPLSALYPVFALAPAVWFLHERLHWRQWLGIAAALGGAVLLAV